MARPLRVAVLHYQPAGDPVDPVTLQVQEVLRGAGHDAVLVGVDDKLTDLLRQLERAKPELVFNLCESFADDYRMEVNVAAVMEMARLPFTGSGTAGLLLAQDKILTKQLLQFHQVPSPRFAMFDATSFATSGDLTFPLIVKPARSDASIGIGGSLVNDMHALSEQVARIRKDLDDDALAEEFIEGRELYVGVVGSAAQPQVLPIVELDFGAGWDPSKPKIANREVKFGKETRDSPKLRIARDVSDELRASVERAATVAYRVLKLSDYARIDFRVSARTNRPYVLEVNPNPYLERQCEVALGAMAEGISYEQLVLGILESAVLRHRLDRKAARATEAAAPPSP